MINDPQWYSVLPPIIAIILAIKTKQVIPLYLLEFGLMHTLYEFNP